MDVPGIIKSSTLLFILLNPFLLSIYLIGLIRGLNFATFARVMMRSVLISGIVFVLFAWLGDLGFTQILQVRFAAFLVFGGIIYVIVGIRFMFQGPEAVELLRGRPEHIAGAVAMPFLIGPGTVNASILAGARLSVLEATLAIVMALALSTSILLLIKRLHDHASQRRAELVDRYVEIAGKASAIVIGTMAIEMLFQGLDRWLEGRNLSQ